MMRKGFALGLWIIPILVIIAVLSVRFLTDMYFSSSKSITSKSYEAFSTVNMAELYEKSLSESLQTMGKNVSYEIGKKGGGIEFWTPDISQEQIKAELEKAIKAELEKIKEIKIPGKNANIIFSPSEVKITPGSDWLASIEFTADVKKPFELNRSLQNINAFFNLKDSGDFKEKFPLAYFAMAEAGRKSFSDFKYSDSFDNGYSGQSGLKSLGTKSSLSHYSSCDCTCPYPSDQEMLSATEWSSIEPTITAIVNKINENMKKTYPYLVFDAKLSETHNKTWEIVSDSKSCPTSTICCGTCKSCSTDPETGEESCTTYCCDYGTECTASRTTTFKFKLNIVFTFFQIDKYSVVPFDGEQSGVFPVKINASFGNYDELEKKDLVDRVDCDNPYLPVWNIGGKWYAYGDSQPKEKFVLLAVDPQVDLTKQYKYVYCENGILINSVKGKATAEQKKESDDGVCAVTFGKENMGTKIGGSCSEEINNTYLIYTDGSSTEVSLSLNKKEFSTEIACYKSTFKYKDDNKQPIIGYSNEEKTTANRLLSEKRNCEGWINAAICYVNKAFNWFTNNVARILEKIFSGLNLSDGWYLENIEEVDASFCPKLDYIKINMKSGTVYRLEYVEPVDIDTSGCNFFDGSVCRKIPYSLSTLNGEKIPYDWLQFIFKFKHYSEWTK